MKVTLLCTDEGHPVNKHLDQWVQQNKSQYDVSIARNKSELVGGDILFLVSCSEFIKASYRALYKSCLVIHAGDLPVGRGWSPHIWEIINGAKKITVVLIEAEDNIDSGRVWFKKSFHVPKDWLWDEINEKLFSTEISLINLAIDKFDEVKPIAQDVDIKPTYYPRRTSKDSEINTNLSISEQFDKIRVSDPHRFPNFFEIHGQQFKLIIEKIKES